MRGELPGRRRGGRDDRPARTSLRATLSSAAGLLQDADRDVRPRRSSARPRRTNIESLLGFETVVTALRFVHVVAPGVRAPLRGRGLAEEGAGPGGKSPPPDGVPPRRLKDSAARSGPGIRPSRLPCLLPHAGGRRDAPAARASSPDPGRRIRRNARRRPLRRGAGTYGIKDPETSEAIFGRNAAGSKDRARRSSRRRVPACMIQLNNGLRGSRRVIHVAQVLAEAYGLLAKGIPEPKIGPEI